MDCVVIPMPRSFYPQHLLNTGHALPLVVEALRSAGSIPDVMTGHFHWHNPSGRTKALGSTQPLTEMSTGNISWGWGVEVAGALG